MPMEMTMDMGEVVMEAIMVMVMIMEVPVVEGKELIVVGVVVE